jgi:hypothetical protein
MKHIILFVTALFSFSSAVICQSSLPDSITYTKDVMTDKEFLMFSSSLLCSEDGKTGFRIDVGVELKGTKAQYNGLIVKSAGVGTCCENNELIILFEDDTKVSMKSWNAFNCEGNSWFDLQKKQFNTFNSKKLKAIRLVNGRTYENYTYQVKPDEAEFFIRCAELISNYKKP